MSGLFPSLPSAVAALGAALVHFLWEAALVGLALAALQPLLRRRTAATRYLAHIVALLALPLLFAFTLLAVASTGADGLGWLPAIAGAEPHQLLLRLFPYLVAAWGVGMAALGVRALGGWALAQRLRRGIGRGTGRGTGGGIDGRIPAAWLERFDQLRRRLGVRGPVGLALSPSVPGPCVLGGWRPLILLPLSALTAVPVEQLQALLAHELAHIRRHDYLVNLLQRAVEVVFFFHPAVWWLSRQASEEREHCCDDLAIAACGDDRLAYARALVGLAEWRTQLVLAAAGGSLARRVRRLVEPASARGPRGAAGFMALGMAALALAGMALAGLPLRPARAPLPALPAAPAPVARAQRVSLRMPAAKPAALELRRPTAQPAVFSRPPAPPRPMRVSWVLAQAVTEVQACAPQWTLTRELLPSGVVVASVRTVTRCVPELREVWVLTTT
ncbi:MAG TPA: M56 family metallopeptidase [Terriglobales bacterium]|nr:M56 family metallopeptidase [Terriglobales bacterium]